MGSHEHVLLKVIEKQQLRNSLITIALFIFNLLVIETYNYLAFFLND